MVRLAWCGRAFLQREQYLQNHKTLRARACLGSDKQLSLAREEGDGRAVAQEEEDRSPGDLGAVGRGVGFILTKGAWQ